MLNRCGPVSGMVRLLAVSVLTLLFFCPNADAAQFSSVSIKPNGYDFRSSETVVVLVCFHITGQFSTSLLGNTLWKAGINTGRFEYTVDLYRSAYGGLGKKKLGSEGYAISADRSTTEGQVRNGCRRFRIRASDLGRGKTRLRAYAKLWYKSGGELTGHTLSSKSGTVDIWVDSKSAYGQSSSKNSSRSSSQSSKTTKPAYRWVTVTEKVKVPYTAYERVAVQKKVQVEKPVTKYRTLQQTCYRDEKVKNRVPVEKWVEERRKVIKTRTVPKKVRQKVAVTKYRTLDKKVAKKVTKQVEKTVGTKTVQERYQTTIMTEVELPVYDVVTTREPKKVTKTRRLKKTRQVSRYKVTKYQCDRKVTKYRREKATTYRYVNEPYKQTVREPYQVRKTVYVNRKVQEPYWTTVNKTVYRTVRRPVRRTRYVTKYRWVRRGNRRVRVPYRQQVTTTVYVTQKVPQQVSQRVKKYRTVTKKRALTKTVTQYRTKVVTKTRRVKKAVTQWVQKPY